MTAVHARIEVVCCNTERFQQVDGEVRRALIRRFPYAVLYLADSESIAVVAVFHTSRGPATWQERVR